jgi:hypothetical protein
MMSQENYSEKGMKNKRHPFDEGDQMSSNAGELPPLTNNRSKIANSNRSPNVSNHGRGTGAGREADGEFGQTPNKSRLSAMSNNRSNFQPP